MPVELQVKLLRVLETGTLMRVGGEDADRGRRARDRGDQPRPRRRPSRDGKLREDLLLPAATCSRSTLPPLRERGDDIELLAEHFLAELNRTERHGQGASRRPRVERGCALRLARQRARAEERRAPGVHHGRWRLDHAGRAVAPSRRLAADFGGRSLPGRASATRIDDGRTPADPRHARAHAGTRKRRPRSSASA